MLVGGSFHMLPSAQGSTGTAAVCIMLPFGALGALCLRACLLLRPAAPLRCFANSAEGRELCADLVERAASPLLGSFLPRLALSPVAMYCAVSGWTQLLGRENSVWNWALLCYCGALLLGWLLAGWNDTIT